MKKRISELSDRTEEIILKAATNEKKEKMRNITEGLSTEKTVKSFNFVSLQIQKEKIKGNNQYSKDSDKG